MKLYGALISPYVRKVAVVAAEKGVPVDMARAGPGSGDAEFLTASPFGKIPAINDDGFTLSDSSAIVCYLDRKYPDPRLIPDEACQHGRAIWFDEFSDTIMGAAGLKILFNRLVGPKILKVGGDEALALQGEAELPRSLVYLESVTPETGWLLGEAFTLADISVAVMFRSFEYVGKGPDAASYPRVAAWYDRVRARASWQAVAAQEEVFARKVIPV